ncbi:MAG: hypothetical protein ACLFSQ_02830 [Candidatus Zixiibacteriota bacterium]
MNSQIELTPNLIFLISMGIPVAGMLLSNTKETPKKAPGVVTFRRKATLQDRRR